MVSPHRACNFLHGILFPRYDSFITRWCDVAAHSNDQSRNSTLNLQRVPHTSPSWANCGPKNVGRQWWWARYVTSQGVRGAIITSLWRQNDVATSFWRYNDVIFASPVCPLGTLRGYDIFFPVWFGEKMQNVDPIFSASRSSASHAPHYPGVPFTNMD